jgi:hypothetical protein
MRKISAIFFVLVLLAVSAILVTKQVRNSHEKTDQNQLSEQKKSASEMKKVEPQTAIEADSPSKAVSPKPNPLAGGVAIPKGTRKMTKGDQVTACTPAYEDMMELTNNPAALDSTAGKITEACLAELSKNVKGFDQVLKKMTEECTGKSKEEYTLEEKNECLRLASVMRYAFAENEFRSMDPKDLPSPVLRAMISLRFLQGDYTNSEADLDYYYRLVAEELRLSPEQQLTSLQSMLIGKLIGKNPEKYQNEYDSVVSDIEKKSPEAGLTSRILRYGNKIGDPNFQTELDDFMVRYPQEPYAIYIKAALMADKKDWAAADAFMAKLLAMPLSEADKTFYSSERKKFASKETGFTQRFSVRVTM